MAWQDEMDIVLRGLVNDLNSTTYTDDSIETILAIAGKYVSQELVFSQNFICSAADSTIIPDPTAAATKDDNFVNLTCLKAAAILDRSSAVLAARQALYVKDGNSAIDLRGIAQSMLKLMEQGWNAVYEEAKWQYQQGDGIAGAAVMGPFRLYAQGCYTAFTGFGGDGRSSDFFPL